MRPWSKVLNLDMGSQRLGIMRVIRSNSNIFIFWADWTSLCNGICSRSGCLHLRHQIWSCSRPYCLIIRMPVCAYVLVMMFSDSRHNLSHSGPDIDFVEDVFDEESNLHVFETIVNQIEHTTYLDASFLPTVAWLGRKAAK